MNPASPLRRRLSAGVLGTSALTVILASQGCLDRDVKYINPQTTAVIVTPLSVTAPDKVDLLLMIDNSSSMADKQTELTRRVPALIQALAQPAPDPTTGKTPKSVPDIHVGVITSSLGSFGTDACDETVAGNEYNDHGHLMPRNTSEASGSGYSSDSSGNPVAGSCPAPVVSAAVSWTFDPKASPAGEFTGAGGVTNLELGASCVVQSAHEDGCGYEASLESVYHFLIDPAPYASATANCTKLPGGVQCDNIVVSGVDSTLLAQRKAFLRPDSLLAVILMTDENDGSLKPAGANWVFAGLPGGTSSHGSQMPRGWSSCTSLPDDYEVEDYTQIEAKGCKWCYYDNSDSNCDINKWTAAGSTDWDQRNLRMFEETHRYGVNGLYARDRYVNGFTQAQVIGSDGNPGPNGIFVGGQRTADLVVLAAIVGVPGTLVNDSMGNPKDLAESDWDKIVNPDHTIRDPHMIESITPRAGIPHFKPSASSNTLGSMPSDFTDPINGGDRDIPDTHDLQYACLGFRSTTTPDSKYPDCSSSSDTSANNPVCGVDGSGNVTQPRYKAYPGLRELRVLHEIGLTGAGVSTVAASICAQSFAPAVNTIVAKLQAALNSQCIRSELNQDPTTKEVNCVIEEVFATNTFSGADPTKAGACESIGSGYCTPGAAPCRVASSGGEAGTDSSSFVPVDVTVAAAQLSLSLPQFDASTGIVQPTSTPAYVANGNVFVDTILDASGTKTTHLICEELQLTPDHTGVSAADTNSCVTDPNFAGPTDVKGGWCYSTVPAVIGDACTKRGSLGTVRFLGQDIPHDQSQVFTVCNE